MNSAANTIAEASFVVLQIGNRRFALPADTVVELAPPVRLHKFPHTTPLVAGVIVRRGRIVPVYDAASVLIDRSLSAQRFYLIARRRFGNAVEFAAIPLNGECELASGEVAAPRNEAPSWVTGTVSFNGESAEILDFSTLVKAKATVAAEQANSEEPTS